MRLDPFQLERFLAEREFSVAHQLSCSDCDGLPLSEVLAVADDESRALWDGLSLGYTESQGHPLLRAEIAKLYSAAGADDVVVAAPEELIFVAMNCLVRNGDHVICTFPAYQSLYQVAEALHCEVTFWEADEKAGWRFDPAKLTDMIRPSTRLLVVNFPHNPTGYLPSRADFDAIIDIARRHEVAVFCDEMYHGLEYDPSLRLPAAVDVYERAVSFSGMSKVYSLAGARIGWLATRDQRLVKRLLAFKDYTTICSSAPSEVLSLMVLRDSERIVARNVATITRNLDLLERFIDRYDSLFAWHRPRAGTVCLPRVLPETLSVDSLSREAQDEAGVVVVPSTVFDYGERHVRMGVGRVGFGDALAAFDAFLTMKLTGAGPRAAAPPAAPPPSAEPAPVSPAVPVVTAAAEEFVDALAAEPLGSPADPVSDSVPEAPAEAASEPALHEPTEPDREPPAREPGPPADDAPPAPVAVFDMSMPPADAAAPVPAPETPVVDTEGPPATEAAAATDTAAEDESLWPRPEDVFPDIPAYKLTGQPAPGKVESGETGETGEGPTEAAEVEKTPVEVQREGFDTEPPPVAIHRHGFEAEPATAEPLVAEPGPAEPAHAEPASVSIPEQPVPAPETEPLVKPPVPALEVESPAEPSAAEVPPAPAAVPPAAPPPDMSSLDRPQPTFVDPLPGASETITWESSPPPPAGEDQS